MNKEGYQEYLKSEHWQRKRQERMAIDDYKCVMCGADKDLQVHHIDSVSYEHLGREDVEKDLVTLCRSCHERIHKFQEQERKRLDEEAPKLLAEIAERIKEPILKYGKDCERRLGEFMGGFNIPRTTKAMFGAERLLRRTSSAQSSVSVEVSPRAIGNRWEGKTLHLKPFCRRGDAPALARILRGKHKAKSPNSICEWEQEWETAIVLKD